MTGNELLELLKEADGLEESMISALTHMISFYIDRNFDFGLDEKEQKEIQNGLSFLKQDSFKHKKILREIKEMVEGGSYDF